MRHNQMQKKQIRVRYAVEEDIRTWRTEVPNTVIKGDFANKLSHFEFRYYIYIRSITGETGEYFESLSTTAKRFKVNRATVSKAKGKLAKYGLIKITKGDKKANESDTITLINIWGMNYDEYKKRFVKKS